MPAWRSFDTCLHRLVRSNGAISRGCSPRGVPTVECWGKQGGASSKRPNPPQPMQVRGPEASPRGGRWRGGVETCGGEGRWGVVGTRGGIQDIPQQMVPRTNGLLHVCGTQKHGWERCRRSKMVARERRRNSLEEVNAAARAGASRFLRGVRGLDDGRSKCSNSSGT